MSRTFQCMCIYIWIVWRFFCFPLQICELFFFFLRPIYIVIALPPFPKLRFFACCFFYELSHKMSSMAKSSLQINEFLIVTFFFSCSSCGPGNQQGSVCLFIFIFAYKSFSCFVYPSNVAIVLFLLCLLLLFSHPFVSVFIANRKFFTLKCADSQILMLGLVSAWWPDLISDIFYLSCCHFEANWNWTRARARVFATYTIEKRHFFHH